MAAMVTLTANAQVDAANLPRTIQVRLAGILVRLEKWPQVSGAKALSGELAGNYRIRTGDYRIVFNVSPDGQNVTIWKIGHRGGVYD